MAENVTTRVLSGWFWQVESVEDVELLRCGFTYSVKAAFSGVSRVFLDARQDVERDLRACAMPFGFQAHAYYAMENEGEETDQGMRADPVWQTVVNWRNLDIGFQDAKAPLDIGQCLVAHDCIGWRYLRDIGQ